MLKHYVNLTSLAVLFCCIVGVSIVFAPRSTGAPIDADQMQAIYHISGPKVYARLRKDQPATRLSKTKASGIAVFLMGLALAPYGFRNAREMLMGPPPYRKAEKTTDPPLTPGRWKREIAALEKEIEMLRLDLDRLQRILAETENEMEESRMEAKRNIEEKEAEIKTLIDKLAAKIKAEKEKGDRVIAEKTADFEAKASEMDDKLEESERRRRELAEDLEKTGGVADEMIAVEKKLAERDARLKIMKSDAMDKDSILRALESNVKEMDAAISKLKEEKAKLEDTRRKEKVEHKLPREITFADAAADGKTFKILYVGRKNTSTSSEPAVETEEVETLADARKLIEKTPFDGLIVHGTILESARPAPLNFSKPVVVAAGAKKTRIMAKAFFPGSIIRFIAPTSFSSRKIVFKTFLEMAPIEMATIFRQGSKRLISVTPKIMAIASKLREIADQASRILLIGPTGSGKELFAMLTHYSRPITEKAPLVPVNCMAITDTLFESLFYGHEKGAFTGADKANPGYFKMAGDGTVFLDEVGELSKVNQAKLLRVLEGHAYIPVGGQKPYRSKAKIILATNRAMDDERLTRKDFIYRIGWVKFKIPSLKERDEEDIRLLARFFLWEHNATFGKNCRFSEAMFQKLEALTPPGNVRELSGLIEWAVVAAKGDALLTKVVLPEDHPDYEGKRPTLTELVDAVNIREITNALIYHDGNLTKAAKRVKLKRTTFKDRAVHYEIPLKGPWVRPGESAVQAVRRV